MASGSLCCGICIHTGPRTPMGPLQSTVEPVVHATVLSFVDVRRARCGLQQMPSRESTEEPVVDSTRRDGTIASTATEHPVVYSGLYQGPQ
eukprot:5506698-Lingulodinium_polyedra.AAC.1